MSGHSLGLITPTPKSIDVGAFVDEVNKALRTLLAQDDDFLVIADVVEKSENATNKVSLILPGDFFYVFNEYKYLKYGIEFFYRFDPVMQDYYDDTMYDFTITEVRHQPTDIQVALAIAMAVAAAKLLAVEYVIDPGGICAPDVVKNDEVPIDEVLSLAVDRRMPLDMALNSFYKGLYRYRR